MSQAVRYSIIPCNPGAHLFEVCVTVAEPDPAGQVFSIAAWIPGSYKIRDYAQHATSIRAESEGRELSLNKTDKSSWQADACDSPIKLIAQIYAHDPSVRGAHLDLTHAFFNGACVFPRIEGQEGARCELEILPPPGKIGKGWRVATSLRPVDAEKYGYGSYEADNYAQLIDQPVEIGNLQIGEFEAGGTPHAIAIRGHVKADMARLCKDLGTLCDYQNGFLGKPADLDRYLFLLNVMGQGYGGLEHCWSSSLACSRVDLPRRGDASVDSHYRKFLGLCSHEYFHLWNVKRMKPARFTPYDLGAESYTGLLWVFEGITSYYDDLFLVRSGLITPQSYFELLGKTITRVIRSHGRFRQTVEESSFDAWTKFYQQHANSTNAIVSYYTKGALIALALDLTLRHRSDGSCSLDDVMKECWLRYGESGEGMPERGLESVAESLLGSELGDFFDHYVRGTGDLPLQTLLAEVGIQLHLRPALSSRDSGGKGAGSTTPPSTWFGANLVVRNGKSIFNTVHSDSPAELSGVAPGDEAVALNDLKLAASNIDEILLDYHAGDRLTLTIFRQDELQRLSVTLAEAPDDTCYLLPDPDASPSAEKKREAWLDIG
jgi:predicted metalloprotease with PDZ domain